MGTKTIRHKAGHIVGFQAIAGAGGVGNSKYVAVSSFGDVSTAFRAAEVLARKMERSHPKRVYKAVGRNAKGIAGLRLEYRPAVSAPILYAVATWFKRGKNHYRAASTEKHGLVGAVARVLGKRDSLSGTPLFLTPRQALLRMKAAL